MKRKNNYYTMMKRFPCRALITLALLTAYASGPKACCLHAPSVPRTASSGSAAGNIPTFSPTASSGSAAGIPSVEK